MADATKVKADVQKGELAPVYVLVGEERYVKDELLALIRAAALGTGVAAFNEDKFTAGDVDVDKVLSAARTVPMMAPKRFVLVRSVDRWESSGDDDDKPAKVSKSAPLSPMEKLAEYLADPVPSSCVVFVAEKLDGRRKFVSVAKKLGLLVPCEPLDRRALPGWITTRCKEKGHAIDHEVADLLAEIAGPELGYVADAVERLSLYVGTDAPITEADVSECITRVRTADTWALVAAVGRRDLASSFKILADVYDPRDRGLPLLGALAWSIRQLARYQAAVEGGQSHDAAAKAAGVFQPFRANELRDRAKASNAREVERWLKVLGETDLALKSSRRPADAILEDMLTRLGRR
ncbi:MAG: DNA polymerase III subunit delta [Polyangiaceae bacterium]